MPGICPLPPPGGSNGGSEGRQMGPGVASLPSVARGGYAKWLVASLQDPGAYGESAPVVLRETAISWVFFAEERVYGSEALGSARPRLAQAFVRPRTLVPAR